MAAEKLNQTVTLVFSPSHYDIWDVARHMESDAQRACLVVRGPAIKFWSRHDWFALCDRITNRESLIVIERDLIIKDEDHGWIPAPKYESRLFVIDDPEPSLRVQRLALRIKQLNPMKLPYKTYSFPDLEVWSGRVPW